MVLPIQAVMATAADIVRNEGVLQLWQGISPALLRNIVYGGCRITFYELLREYGLGHSSSGQDLAPAKAFLAALISGAAAQFIASPTDLVKVRMQTQGRDVREGKPARYRNVFHAFIVIGRTEGVLGLWKGCIPNVQRAALVTCGDVAVYDTAKRFLILRFHLQDSTSTHMLASLCSGFSAAVLSTPADVLKSRIMHSREDYRGTLDCLRKTVQRDGVLALWRGLILVWLRAGCYGTCFWLVNENSRRWLGLRSF